jgi:hypothetical protein
MIAMTLTKFKLKKEIHEEVEITLPYYCKNSVAIYKILDENSAIKVGTVYPEISIQGSKVVISVMDSEADAKEFEQVYNNVVTFLNRKAGVI